MRLLSRDKEIRGDLQVRDVSSVHSASPRREEMNRSTMTATATIEKPSRGHITGPPCAIQLATVPPNASTAVTSSRAKPYLRRDERGSQPFSTSRSNGAAEPAVMADVLDLIAEAIWADVTVRNRDYGSVPGGNEP